MAFVGSLYPFQQEAADFMVERGLALVAMDMGTGKTPTTIYAVEQLISEGVVACGMVIAPASLKYQWKRQIAKFTDGAHTLVVDGTPQKRLRQYARIRSGEIEYAILNYEQVVNDWKYVRDLPTDFIVGDEIQAIKSFESKRSKQVKRLHSDFIFGLTGQPLENRPEDVYSIMQWVDESVLGRFDIFDKTFMVRDSFGKLKRTKNLPTLRKRLNTAMVRRTRDEPEVREQMPRVSESTMLIDFDRQGSKLYTQIVDDLLGELEDVTGSTFNVFDHYNGMSKASSAELQQRGRIMSRLTCLRMLCDHPDLRQLRAAAVDDPDSSAGSVYASGLKAAGDLEHLTAAPKMAATMEFIGEVLSADERNKVVLFSFFKPTLRLIAAAASKMTDSVMFTGDMSAKQKDAALMEFYDNSNCRLFLSSDAGGAGVDLPNANYLISYDLPWSAGKMDQRNARIIRLSSEFDNVFLVNILMKGSIEERQYAMLEQKRAIASAIVDGKGIDKEGGLTLGLSTLREFLELTEVGYARAA